MKVDYVSDLHLNHWVLFKENQRKLSKRVYDFLDAIFESKDEESEVLVLGGDYSEYNQYTEWMINYVSKIYDKVIIVFGNHDYYFNSKTQKNKFKGESINRVKDIVDYVEMFDNVDVLENEGLMYRGKMFWGTVNYPYIDLETLEFMKEHSNDYKCITHDSFQFMGASSWPDIVQVDLFISHVPPLEGNPFALEPENKLYYSDLMLGDNVKNVVFGHDHFVGKFQKDKIKYHTNALGYPEEYTTDAIRDYDLSDIIRTLEI